MADHRADEFVRTDAPDLVEAYLLRGADVELLGMRGSGRSTILRVIADRLRARGSMVLHLQPVAGSPSSVGRAMRAHVEHPPAREQSSRLTLTDLASKNDLVVLVDDAEALEDSAWHELALARQSSSLPLVAAHLEERLPPRSGFAALGSRLTGVVRAPMLSLTQVRLLLEERFDSAFDASTVSRIFHKSGGNPGTALTIAEVAIINGVISPVDGVQAAHDGLWNPQLTAMIERNLAHLDEQERMAVSTLALAGAISIEAAAIAVPVEVLQRLEVRGIVHTYSESPTPWLALHPPLLTEHFRDQARGIRGYRANARLDSASLPTLRVRSSAPGRLALDRVDPHFLRLARARRLHQLHDAKSAWAADPSIPTALALLEALNNTAAPRDDVDAVLRDAADLPANSEERAHVKVWHASWLAYAHDDLVGALAMLNEQDDLGAYARLLDAAAIDIQTDLDRIPRDALELLHDDPHLPAHVRNTITRTRASTLLWSGKNEQAAHTLEGLPEWPEDRRPYIQAVLRAYLEYSRGDFDRAVSAVNAGIDQACIDLDRSAIGAFFQLGSLLLLARGHLSSLKTIAENLIGDVDTVTFPRSARVALYCATAASARVPEDTARRLQDLARGVRTSHGALPGGTLSWSEARFAIANGELDAAADLLWRAAEDAWERGYILAGCSTAVGSLEARPDAARLERLLAHIRGTESSLMTAFGEYVRVLAAGDVEATLACADELASTGSAGRAVLMYGLAARRAHLAGDTIRESIARESGDALAESAAREDVDSLTFASRSYQLSAREQDVALLVAEGLSNQQIADRLFLSVRTVENHVHRAMRKLDVASRQQLALAAGVKAS